MTYIAMKINIKHRQIWKLFTKSNICVLQSPSKLLRKFVFKMSPFTSTHTTRAWQLRIKWSTHNYRSSLAVAHPSTCMLKWKADI